MSDPWVLVALLSALAVVGVGTLVWGTAGLARSTARLLRRRPPATDPALTVDDVAVLIAAHNEALVLQGTIDSARRHVRADQVFVVSDGSTDATVAIARAAGVNVLALDPNRGKAGAIAAAVERFGLERRFAVVLLLDADTVLSDDYFATGLPLFAAPDVVAVAGRASTRHARGAGGVVAAVLTAYRQRVYLVMQWAMKYGQAARAANAVSIVPGFASMYRSHVLATVDIAAPGLTIEDYNVTFEIHARELGRIAFHPRAAVAYTQDPATLRDYAKQVARWSLGFWQTVRRHPWRPRVFWVALWAHIVELVIAAVAVLLVLPLAALSLVASAIVAIAGPVDAAAADAVAAALPPGALVVGVLAPDLVLTLWLAVAMRRPVVLLFGLVFPFIRMLDAAMCLRAVARAFRRGATGVWVSPVRRAAGSQ
ncbi:glycosyltransferase family 2 protein [Galbitalea sp. SE-J8]|uniref:glycosyltransferase family 2 protein n=1 Tax=Galbitalea sp. SE-J8 TaxID=3054952 RepID=UPI00259C8FD0|nr:glycosyltransferase family 2 protein [Galbitalea sp. SE-J8]MDM4763270.1 glycosyltransferase family 2 protein [Galbitalea sp. SE-J8]